MMFQDESMHDQTGKDTMHILTDKDKLRAIYKKLKDNLLEDIIGEIESNLYEDDQEQIESLLLYIEEIENLCGVCKSCQGTGQDGEPSDPVYGEGGVWECHVCKGSGMIPVKFTDEQMMELYDNK